MLLLKEQKSLSKILKRRQGVKSRVNYFLHPDLSIISSFTLQQSTWEDLWQNYLPITTESLMDNMTTVTPVNETTTTPFGSDVNDDPMVISAPGWAVTINSFLEVNLGVSLFFLMLVVLCSLFLILICMIVWNCTLKYKLKNKISDVRTNFHGYDRIMNNDGGEINANETLDTRVDDSPFAADGTLRSPPASPQTDARPKTSSVSPPPSSTTTLTDQFFEESGIVE